MQNIGAMVDSYWDRRMARAEREAADREQAVDELLGEQETAVAWIEDSTGLVGDEVVVECIADFANALCAASDASAHKMIDHLRKQFRDWVENNEDIVAKRVEATDREYAEAAAEARASWGDV